MARRVEQVDDLALVRELHHRRGHRDAALLLQRHPVRGGAARGLAALHRAGHLDRTAEQQQLLGQRGLARIRMADDGEGAAAAGFLEMREHGGGSAGERTGNCSVDRPLARLGRLCRAGCRAAECAWRCTLAASFRPAGSSPQRTLGSSAFGGFVGCPAARKAKAFVRLRRPSYFLFAWPKRK